jgi:hypothetical protein
MKKVFLTFSLFCLSIVILQAQFSVVAGLNIAKGDFILGTTNLANEPLYGFNAGVVGNFKISGPLYLNTGVLYTQKGTCIELTAVETHKANLMIEYIEVPVNLKAKIDAGALNLFAHVGLYGAYAIANKMSSDDSGDDDYNFDFGNEEDTMDRLDFGYNIGAGIGFSSIEILVNYSEGFNSVYNPMKTVPGSIKNKVISLSASFAF